MKRPHEKAQHEMMRTRGKSVAKASNSGMRGLAVAALLVLAAGEWTNAAWAQDVPGCNGAWGDWQECVLDPNLGVFKRYRFFRTYTSRRLLLSRGLSQSCPEDGEFQITTEGCTQYSPPLPRARQSDTP